MRWHKHALVFAITANEAVQALFPRHPALGINIRGHVRSGLELGTLLCKALNASIHAIRFEHRCHPRHARILDRNGGSGAKLSLGIRLAIHNNVEFGLRRA